MAAIARGQPPGGRPVLDLFTPTCGMLADVARLEFQIFDLSDDGARTSPVQVYPSGADERAVVNTTDPWPDGDKLGTGHYAARWTPPPDEHLGLHQIRWFIGRSQGASEEVEEEAFDVLAEGASSSAGGYALVSDLREEGVTAADASDARLARLLLLESQYIDRVTGRFFEPRAMRMRLNGRGGRALQLGHPIIAVRDVKMFFGLSSATELGGVLPVDPSSFRVYNRHLTEGLLDPDDREDPKLEFFHGADLLGVHQTPAGSLGLGSLVWLPGVHNVVIDGVFGFTDPDGSAVGCTPALIRHATKLLVLREIPKMTDLSRREERQRRWRLVSEHTRDQGYNLAPLGSPGAFTGDPEIDDILVTYARPPQLGAA